MKLRKVDWWEVPKKKKTPVTSNNVTVLPLHTKEIVREAVQPDLDAIMGPLKKELDWLKKRRPEFVGGVGATGTYHRVEVPEIRFSKASFNPGINVIGVATGIPTTIWLPRDMEHNHLVAVKDELGIADQQPITIRVAS